jgi:hypothetical protein
MLNCQKSHQLTDIFAVNRDGSTGCLHDPEEGQCQGRFTGSRSSNDANLFIKKRSKS